MPAHFHDESTGRPRALKPEAPPNVDFAWDPPRNPRMLASLRAETVVSALHEALRHLGYAVDMKSEGRAVDLYWGSAPPPMPARCWLKPGETEAAVVNDVLALGFSLEDVRFYCLARHYRKPLGVDRAELERCRDDLRRLGDSARRLAGFASAAPNAAGLAGYKKRFRDALARDLDLPEALASVWDALRPGALSPGSQFAILREADPVLGFSLLEKARR